MLTSLLAVDNGGGMGGALDLAAALAQGGLRAGDPLRDIRPEYLQRVYRARAAGRRQQVVGMQVALLLPDCHQQVHRRLAGLRRRELVQDCLETLQELLPAPCFCPSAQQVTILFAGVAKCNHP